MKITDGKLRLGVNIDHVATVRNARGGTHPDPVRAAKMAVAAGADGITAHLREDRRHIHDADITRLKDELTVPLNLEMAATTEMAQIALSVMPHACCLVPERREEVTTEGGLDVLAHKDRLAPVVQKLAGAGIRVSLFVEPAPGVIDAAREIGAQVVELHTGAYAEAPDGHELERLVKAAAHAGQIGMECHAGHGLNYVNVKPVAAIAQVVELNIGHHLVGDAIFCGMEAAVTKMRRLMNEARKEAA